MKASHFVSFFAVLSTALLASCGGQSSTFQVPATFGTLTFPAQLAEISPEHGGSFSANASGALSVIACSATKEGSLTFSGTGEASFLHRMKESGSTYGGRHPCYEHGKATLVAVSKPSDTVTVKLSGEEFFFCKIDRSLGFTVTRGTGRFSHATGSGTVTFTCHPKSGMYTDVWSGTLNF